MEGMWVALGRISSLISDEKEKYRSASPKRKQLFEEDPKNVVIKEPISKAHEIRREESRA